MEKIAILVDGGFYQKKQIIFSVRRTGKIGQMN